MAMDRTFDAHRLERDITAAWEAAGAFRAGANAAPGAERFCIMIPPPNVTGSLHMGHAFNNTLQDILTRWHRQRRFDTLWQPGTDHAGIATQMVVERELAKEGKSRRDFTREDFVARVWQQKVRSRENISTQLKRLGASCDWDREAFTMSGAPGAPAGEEGNFHDAVLKVFVELYQQGYIYRGKRLVNWDPHFETAISDLEVEQVETDGHLWRLKYRLADGVTYRHPVGFDEDGTPTAWEERDYLVVATTRPETMLGDTGIAVHPDDPRYAGLVGGHVILPLVGRHIPIVADSYADPEKGTGAVKMTPAHDFNDWEVGQRQGLRVVNVMTSRAGMFLKGNEDFAEGCDADGLARVIEAIDAADRYEARDWIVRTAEDEGWLDGLDPDRHMVPHGDRSKVAIEPYLTDQWFVDAEKLGREAIAAVRDGRTRILPEQHEKVYFHWMENLEPWCISRQLWWGHQVPVWYGPSIDESGVPSLSVLKPFCALSKKGAYLQARDYYPEHLDINFGTGSRPHEGWEWAKDDPESFRELARKHGLYTLESGMREPPFAGLKFRRSGEGRVFAVVLERDPDVLDTWFSSALWPFGTLGWPEATEELKRYYPGNVLITGFDIIFFWVARMMMMGTHFMKDANGAPQVPFRDVYVHALVRDEKGKKMSKSLGNVLDPLDLIEKYGADPVRFTLASMAAMGRDLKLAESRIAGYRNFVTKLWNAARFAEMNGAVPSAAEPVPPEAAEPVNRWILGEIARAERGLAEALDAYRFNDAANGLYAFVWGRVCDWYLELAKPLLAEDHPARAETQAVLGHVIDACLVLLHPFMPFVTEALWGQLGPRPKMLAHGWLGPTVEHPEADAETGWVIALIEEIRSVRAEVNVAPGAQVPLVIVEAGAAEAARLEANAALIGRLARVPGMMRADAPPRGAVTLTVPGATLCLPLAGVIDVAAERARLDKAMARLGKEISGLTAKLSNEKFLAKAPEDVVDENRARLAEAEEEAARLRAALGRLAALE